VQGFGLFMLHPYLFLHVFDSAVYILVNSGKTRPSSETAALTGIYINSPGSFSSTSSKNFSLFSGMRERSG
jgi:hypothetical protein